MRRETFRVEYNASHVSQFTHPESNPNLLNSASQRLQISLRHNGRTFTLRERNILIRFAAGKEPKPRDARDIRIGRSKKKLDELWKKQSKRLVSTL